MPVRVIDGRAQRIGGRRPSQAQVDDVRAIVGGINNAGSNVAVPAVAVLIEHLDRHDARAPRDAGDADAVIRGGGGDAGDMRAVPIVILHVSVFRRDEVLPVHT